MTVGSLFSGIGGLDLGLERAGMEVKWQVEIDPFCQKVLAKHWPGVTRYGDIKTLTGEELEPVDLICGGFPCQPVSVAGKRLAQADERWLWPEFQRVLGVVRPRYVVIENVPGLYDRGLSDVLGGLAALGFDAEWTHLSAASFGAPHLRERIFIVAYAPGERCGREPFFNTQHDLPHYREWDAAQGIRGWKGWQRWLNEVNQTGIVTHAAGTRLEGHGRELIAARPSLASVTSADSHGGAAEQTASLLCGVDDGIPDWMDRMKSLGNAVVPQVAEWIGRRIVAVDGATL